MRAFLNRLWTARRALAFYALLLGAGWLAGTFLKDLAIPEMRPMNEPLIHRIVMGALLVFVLAAAIPFVPGAEIGFALLLLFGAQAAALVYIGMVGALLLAYCTARLIPLGALSAAAGWLRLNRVSKFFQNLAETPPDQRHHLISETYSGKFTRAALRNRYLLLALVLNMPGNSVLGGGGGLAFLAGISGLYRFWPTLAAVLIAVAPVPLAVSLMAG